MAKTYSRETAGPLGSTAFEKTDSRTYRSTLKRIRATVDYDGQASGDTISLGKLPAGAVFSHGVMMATATAGATATIAIGTAASAASMRTAAVFTAVDTPTLFGKTAAVAADPLSGETEILATVGAASLPDSAAYMTIDIFYSDLS